MTCTQWPKIHESTSLSIAQDSLDNLPNVQQFQLKEIQKFQSL